MVCDSKWQAHHSIYDCSGLNQISIHILILWGEISIPIYLLTAKLPLCLVWTAISHAWCWFLSDRVLRYLRIVSSCWLVRIPLNPVRYPSSPHEIPMKSQWNHHSIPFNPLKFPVDPTLNHMKSLLAASTTSSVWPLSRSGACSCGRGRWWLFHLNITPF